MKTPNYVYGIWFVGNPRGDWLGQLYKDSSDGQWVFKYRFRYYDHADPDNDAFSGKDKKSWYAFGYNGTDDKIPSMVAHMEATLFRFLEMRYGHKIDFVDLQCREDDPSFMEKLSSRPWCHVQSVTPEEFERMERGEQAG